MMPRKYSSIWLSIPSDLTIRVERCIEEARAHTVKKGPGSIFFRADDVAVPGKQLSRLIELFIVYRVPLALAVVPAWLTEPRWKQLEKLGRTAPDLWCWHQHGWRHVNHEAGSKKQEFGSLRSPVKIKKDLRRGRDRLERLMGSSFYPVFTPPWNRCGLPALKLLKRSGYYAVSRSNGSLPPSPDGLPDFQVNVDLHTRKEVNPLTGWDNFLSELRQAIVTGRCGVMIHHQLMNDAAFDFLEVFLKTIIKQKDLLSVNFKNMVETEGCC
jgi:peptidoglycan/xylan/chitin deacetylase (PgdA/CDA1 family)